MGEWDWVWGCLLCVCIALHCSAAGLSSGAAGVHSRGLPRVGPGVASSASGLSASDAPGAQPGGAPTALPGTVGDGEPAEGRECTGDSAPQGGSHPTRDGDW